MITLLRLDDDSPRPLAFYLAAEEWAASDEASDDDYFMTWRVRPTVIIGRHQSLADEVDTSYCRSHGIDIVRRKSGGGAVYADMDNVMFSYIAFPMAGESIEDTFRRFTSKTALMLRALGVDAQVSGRNDLTVEGCKISGYSYLAGKRRHIIHGTLLYDFDAEVMGKVLTPQPGKLESHGVKSVRSRVTSLRRYLGGMEVGAFRSLAEQRLSDAERVITADEVEAIRAIEESYYRPGWLEGRRHTADRMQCHIDGDGTLTVSLSLDADGRIRSVTATGDVMTPDDVSEALTRELRGASRDAACRVIKRHFASDATSHRSRLMWTRYIASLRDNDLNLISDT